MRLRSCDFKFKHRVRLAACLHRYLTSIALSESFVSSNLVTEAIHYCSGGRAINLQKVMLYEALIPDVGSTL
jgi:hypothetical protein